MTPKEAFRMISHKFHGKGPGKMKQEKRMKQYQEELKLKQMKNSDTPSQSVERMREAQARLKTPYLVLSGHVKPGQTSDPRSGFATVEKDVPGSLTPMLGDRKVSLLFIVCLLFPHHVCKYMGFYNIISTEWRHTCRLDAFRLLDPPICLTWIAGDVEHFLGIKRKAEPSNMGPPKKPKT
ncbi:SART-1 family protein DOT2 [Vitis vinifera]|uniref:SART-1 family protein DOT2 n=1 Tax=Vitis vinifera TaxID=29760 RepID=A0A438HNN9_VITVI|nr:SART-1 family protein DOT2 [Vitis vinifera]